MSATQPPGRGRAYAEFLAATIYYLLARSVAQHAALALTSDQTAQWFPLLEQTLLAALLLLGYMGMGRAFDRERFPIAAQGFPPRPGLAREVGLGLATGWGLTVACVLPLVAVGGIAIRVTGGARSWGWLAADTAFFAMAALAEEAAFRGYGFQRFAQAVGPLGASLGFAASYAVVEAVQAGSSRASVAVSVMLCLVLSMAYVRTRALWLSWGLNFGWKASRALVFGLALSGVNSHSPVVQGDPMGPFWITGGGFGLESSWVTFFVLVAALPVVYRLTRDLDFRYNAPVIVPAGIPVDLDAASRRQHEAAMGPAAPAAPSLVQILPAGVLGAAEPAPADPGHEPQ